MPHGSCGLLEPFEGIADFDFTLRYSLAGAGFGLASRHGCGWGAEDVRNQGVEIRGITAGLVGSRKALPLRRGEGGRCQDKARKRSGFHAK